MSKERRNSIEQLANDELEWCAAQERQRIAEESAAKICRGCGEKVIREAGKADNGHEGCKPDSSINEINRCVELIKLKQ